MKEFPPVQLLETYRGRARIDPHIHLEGPLKGASEVIEYLDRHGVDVGFLIASPLREGKGSLKENMPSAQKWYLGGLGNTFFGHFVSDTVMRPLIKGMITQSPDNGRVIAVSREHPDRLMAWLFANPKEGINKTLDEMKAVVDSKSVNVAGFKLHFWVYPADIADPQVMQIADLAQEKKLPILVDVGVNRENMKRFNEFASRHPEVPIIAAHLGSFLPEVIASAQKNPNVFLDMSGYPVTGRNLRKVLTKLSADKVIFGSDSPGGLGGSIVSQLKALHGAHLTMQEEDLILTGNIKGIVPKIAELLKNRNS